jgi:hypothetical protein
METNTTIDWLNHYMALPLTTAIDVKAGDVIHVSFQYRTGGSIDSLQNSIQVSVNATNQQSQAQFSMAEA